MRLCVYESLTCEFFYCFAQSIRLRVPVSVTECMIDYLMETTYIYICALLCFYYVESYVSVEYYNHISTYGINGCRSTCVAASGRD